MDVEDLLLSDNENDDKNKEERPYISKRINTKINSSYAQKDLDNNKKSTENDNEKILVASKILINDNDHKQKEPNPNVSEPKNNLLAFVFNTNANQMPIKTEQNSQPIYQENINNNPNLNNNFNIQSANSPSSSNFNYSLDKASKQIKAVNKVSANSSSMLQQPPQQVNENIIFDERKQYEDKIKEYKIQKENLKKAYPIEMERKIKEYQIVEKNCSKEIEDLEKRYKNELIDQENFLNQKTNRYNKEISDIEEERKKKLTQLRNYYDTLYKQELEKIENKFNLEKENIESNHLYELEQINIDLENIKENNKIITSDKLSSIRVDDLYDELYKKINDTNKDVELKIEQKKNELLKRQLEVECEDLSQEIRKIKENTEMYEKGIFEKKKEMEEILDKFETERRNLKNKEFEIRNKELKNKYYYEERINNVDNEIKKLEIKFNEEKNLYDLNNDELTKEKNKLQQQKELFETNKIIILQNLEDKQNEINLEINKIKKYEDKLDTELNDLKIKEMEIINDLNEIQNLNHDIFLEKENIEKEKYNNETMDQRIHENIVLLNEEKEEIEREKERIKKQEIEIEIESKKLDEELNKIEQENKLFDLKNQTIDNMRMDFILNNKYENEEIGLKTMPDFKNNGIDNYKVNGNEDIKPKNNFSQTFTAFNNGKSSKKFNADEYFNKLNQEINTRKNIDNNINDFDSYLINGRNFIKDTREQLEQLNNK